MNIVVNNTIKAVLLLAIVCAIAPIFAAALTARGKYIGSHSVELQQSHQAAAASEADR